MSSTVVICHACVEGRAKAGGGSAAGAGRRGKGRQKAARRAGSGVAPGGRQGQVGGQPAGGKGVGAAYADSTQFARRRGRYVETNVPRVMPQTRRREPGNVRKSAVRRCRYALVRERQKRLRPNSR